MSRLLKLAAVLLFANVAAFLFGWIGGPTFRTDMGLLAAGLAFLAAAALVP